METNHTYGEFFLPADESHGRPVALPLCYRAWKTPGKPRAVLVAVHGLFGHGGRYADLGALLRRRDFALYSFDHIGHGKSGGRRAHVSRFTDFTDAVAEFYWFVSSLHPATPVFILGHSMGGLVCIHALCDRELTADGLILIAPYVAPQTQVTKAMAIAGWVVSALVPTLRLMGVKSEDVGEDAAASAKYTSDPLVYHGKATARLLYCMFVAIQRAPEALKQLRCPLLFVQGGSDQLVSPAEVRSLFEGLESTDKTYIEYPEASHEILQSRYVHEAVESLTDWVVVRSHRGGSPSTLR